MRQKQPVTDEAVTKAWQKATGEPPPKKRIDQELVKLGGDAGAGIDCLARRLLARPLTAEERAVVQRVLDRLVAKYRKRPAEARKLIAVGASRADASLNPSTLAAWTMLANTLMNLDEVLNK